MRLRKVCVVAGVVFLFALGANADDDDDDDDGDGDSWYSSATAAATVESVSDFDGDGVPDSEDNCTLVGNAGQEDFDGDGFGNICDGDFNQDCLTSIIDWGIFTPCLTAPGTKPQPGCDITDLNSDSRINARDLHIFEDLFNLPPGPCECAGCCTMGRCELPVP